MKGMVEVHHADQIELYVRAVPTLEVFPALCGVPKCVGVVHCFNAEINKMVCSKHNDMTLLLFRRSICEAVEGTPMKSGDANVDPVCNSSTQEETIEVEEIISSSEDDVGIEIG